MALNEKQKRFASEYLKDLNATQAAIRAGYSEKTAGQIGEQLLKKLEIFQWVEKMQQERSERVRIDADYVLTRLGEIDDMDALDILTDDGAIKPIKDWPKIWRQMISGLDVMEVGGDTLAIVKKIKWPDKVKNLELIGRHISVQAFRDQVKTESTVSLADALREARARRKGEQ